MEEIIPHSTRFITIRDENAGLSRVKINIFYENRSNKNNKTDYGNHIYTDQITTEKIHLKRKTSTTALDLPKRYPRQDIMVEAEVIPGTSHIQSRNDWTESSGFSFSNNVSTNCSRNEVYDERSKNDKMVTCRMCGSHVHPQKRRQHIYLKHFRTFMYQCPICGMGHPYHRGLVEQHIKKIHGKHDGALSLREECGTEINIWMYKCFEDKRLLKFVDENVCAAVNYIVNTICTNDSDVIASVSVNPNIVDSPPVKIRKATTCQLCGMGNIKHLERHVLQYHMKKATFLCPFCQYSSNYAVNAVKDHIKKKHDRVTGEDPIDLRGEHWRELRSLYETCFIPSPLKNEPQPQVFYTL